MVGGLFYVVGKSSRRSLPAQGKVSESLAWTADNKAVVVRATAAQWYERREPLCKIVNYTLFSL